MSDPVEAAILVIKERARADAAEARLKRLIDVVDEIIRFLNIKPERENDLRDALREARGEEAKT